MERDADSLKPSMVEYLEALEKALQVNHDDVDELRKIMGRLTADKSTLAGLETRMNEKISYLVNMKAKKAEIADVLGRAVRERKE